ncbi:MAG: GIY-YIG nuclease family protein [Acidobacteria bacterium]|nr:GIY-YIG nuclease family protein [Acidobacteriota bacterium]
MPSPKDKPTAPPSDVVTIRRAIRKFLDSENSEGRKIGGAKFGVYAFYDYDGEPIYVGQTNESLRQRISRHLTNQRTDAVAMSVLDPFEVAEIEVWPLWELQEVDKGDAPAKRKLDQLEYTVYHKVLNESSFRAVLNEKPPTKTDLVKLPNSHRSRIIPADLYEGRKHPDVRIARRATTIASLARVISERMVSPGLRRTLLTQAKRLERLAEERLRDFKTPG